ncbi:MAG: HD domain-containing protein [Bacteroidota bacterium]
MTDNFFFSPLIEQAAELAAEWHAGTYRKGRWRHPSFLLEDGDAPKIPVMAHVTTVAITVQRAGWDEVTVAAAFLHDILEDPNQLGEIMTFEALEARVGHAVAHRVREVSEAKKDANGKKQMWKARKVGYIEGLKVHSIEASAISLADKIHNLWSLNESLEKGINIFSSTKKRRGLSAGPAPQRWFYNAVYKATLHHQDRRIQVMQARFKQELERFEMLTEPMVDTVESS